MKVVTPSTMVELEKQAYEQGCSEKELMENAGRGISLVIQTFIEKHSIDGPIWLLCGKGNNGGDAFVAGCYLLENGFQVIAIQKDAIDSCSPLCQENHRRFVKIGGKVIDSIDSFPSSGLIVDGLFGTGFKGSIRPPYDSLIHLANESKIPILAIDIPSGLDGTTGRTEGPVIQATETMYLGLPKTGFFLGNGWNVVGRLQKVDFGLPKELVSQAAESFRLVTKESMQSLLPPMIRKRHKYQAGYVIGLAGSPTMPGAAILSTLAAFRGGSGIVRLLYPKGMEQELSSSFPELIKMPYALDDPEEVVAVLQKAGSVFVGPGLGRSENTQQFLQKIVPLIEVPCVIDADALILHAKQNFSLPKQTIFTPHMGEMQQLLHASSHLELDNNLLKICQQYANNQKVTLVLKGAPSFIFHSNMPIFVNLTGDPGMATAGSGDVLTGLLASLLSQGLSCHQAALLGVYIHGLAGEEAVQARGTSYGLMASDLITYFCSVYRSL